MPWASGAEAEAGGCERQTEAQMTLAVGYFTVNSCPVIPNVTHAGAHAAPAPDPETETETEKGQNWAKMRAQMGPHTHLVCHLLPGKGLHLQTGQ